MKKIISLLIALSLMTPVFAETVMMNVNTKKYHKEYCRYVNKNCIKIEKKEAIKRGGVPCKVCGG
jgi:hypothetical protein